MRTTAGHTRYDPSFTGVDDSPVGGDGEEGPLGPSPEPRSKSAAAHGAPRKGRGGAGGGAAAAPSLDDLSKHNRNSDAVPERERSPTCGLFALVRRRAVTCEIDVYDHLRLKCKAWHCGECGPRKAVRLRKAIEATARDLNLTRFLTLTLDPSKLPPDEDDLVLYIRGKVWAKFRTYLKRKYKKPIVYIAVLEFTKAGIPHLHILVNRYIPQPWIKQSWDALGGGRIVFIKRVYDLHRMTHYLGKYLTKAVILSAPRGVRRWTASRSIKLLPKRKSTGEWTYPFRTFDILQMIGWRSVVLEEVNRDGQVYAFTTTEDLLAM